MSYQSLIPTLTSLPNSLGKNRHAQTSIPKHIKLRLQTCSPAGFQHRVETKGSNLTRSRINPSLWLGVKEVEPL